MTIVYSVEFLGLNSKWVGVCEDHHWKTSCLWSKIVVNYECKISTYSPDYCFYLVTISAFIQYYIKIKHFIMDIRQLIWVYLLKLRFPFYRSSVTISKGVGSIFLVSIVNIIYLFIFIY